MGEEKMFDLADILTFKMNEDEAKAYKIAAAWIDLSRQCFPNYNHTGLPTRRDPRTSLLYKYCYKLMRETRGILEEHEYPLYIRAQLDILKIMTTGKNGPRVEANCLVGDKAWKRWKVWKKHYDRKVKFQQPDEPVAVDASYVRKELAKAKIHLESRFNGFPGVEEYAIRQADIGRWVAIGRISPYYAVLSPWFAKHVDQKELGVDLGVYKKDITTEIDAEFRTMFPHEFS